MRKLSKVFSALLVKIEVENASSAFILFESINNRGIPLTPIDLIKNSIIDEMEKKGTKPEDTNKQWQTLIENIESYEDQVRFLRHYYNAFQCCNDKVKLSPFTKATKSNIIKIYSEHIKKDVKFIFNELIEKSKIYTILINPESIESCDSNYKYQDKLIDLKRLGIAPAYSLLLYLFSEKKDEDFTKLLDFIENWFLRRYLTDYLATNKLDQIFLDLINVLANCDKENKNILDNNSLYDAITKYLMDPKRYKSDEEFKKILKESPLYDINTNATRCLLIKLEKSKRTRENKNDFWEMTKTGKKPVWVWSIEHIYPQTPDKKSNWEEIIPKELGEKYLHRLGNLTLTCYNSTLSNKSFEKKLTVEKDGKDIGLKSGNVKINDYLKRKTDNVWTVNDIEARSEEMATDIIDLFNTKD